MLWYWQFYVNHTVIRKYINEKRKKKKKIKMKNQFDTCFSDC